MSVSVVIPTCNRRHRITTAIDSVLSQTYKDLEIIVVDDGSTDGTGEELERRYGSRLRYLYQENKGPGAARNVALDLAAGEYIAFLDSDDSWLDFKIKLQVELLEHMREIGFVFSEFDIVKDSGAILRRGSRSWLRSGTDLNRFYQRKVRFSSLGLSTALAPQDFEILAGQIYGALLYEFLILPSTSLLRRSCLTPRIRFTETRPSYEDCEFFARLAREHEGAFMDLSTTINGGYDDPTRVSHCGDRVNWEKRIDLIERVWGADPEFISSHGQEVCERLGGLHLKRAFHCLLADEPQAARDSLIRRRALNIGDRMGQARLLGIASRLPCSGVLMRAVASSRRFARGLYSRERKSH